MSTITSLALATAGAAAILTVAITHLGAVERGTVSPVAQLKISEGPQPGDCKRSFSAAIGQNPAMAQAIWTSTVASQYGNNWAHWVGAKNKTIVAVGGGASPQYQARAMPCFHHPVP